MSTAVAPTIVQTKHDLHLVLHTRRLGHSGEFATSIVAGPIGWLAAQNLWEALDNTRRRKASQTTRRIEEWYSVRHYNDPKIAPLLADVTYHKDARNAAKGYAAKRGIRGNKGGWIGDFHGWDSYALHLLRTGGIAMVSHPRTFHADAAFAAYGTSHVGSPLA